MEPLIISEQDIINALCLFMSRERHVEPDEVEVELIYDDEAEIVFSAEAYIIGQQHLLFTVQIIAALRLWIDLHLEMDAIAAGIKLDFNETDGIFATVR